jgi:hypothetical protein
VVLADLLQIAARHVQADAVAEDVVVRFFRVDAPAALADGDHHLRLVVVIRGLGRVVHIAAARDQRVRRLEEEEGGLAPVSAHLLLVLHVVAADAEYAPHREPVLRILDGERRDFPNWNCVRHALRS